MVQCLLIDPYGKLETRDWGVRWEVPNLGTEDQARKVVGLHESISSDIDYWRPVY